MKKAKKTKETRLTNPNGVNQFTAPDPRQALFLSLYLDPKSETFGNAYQSALRAKYSEEYAQVLKGQMPAWLSENLSNNNFLADAEKHFREVMQVPIYIQAMGAFGPLFKKIPTGKFRYVNKKIQAGKHKGKYKKVREEIFEQEPIMTFSASYMKEKTKVAEILAAAHNKALYGKPENPGKGNVFNFTQIKNDIDQYQ